jgi:hypothetical protein
MNTVTYITITITITITIFIVFCILYQYNFFTDFFTVVSYNSYNINEGDKSPYIILLKELSLTFNNYNNKNLDINGFDTSKFILLNNNLHFDYNNLFKDQTLVFLKQFFPEQKITIQELSDIFIDFNGNYIFTANINTQLANHKIQIKASYLYQQIPIVFLGVKLLGFDLEQQTIKGIDALYPNKYQIKNNLYLTDPFLTSGKDLYISDEMTKTFTDKLLDQRKQAQLLSTITYNEFNSKIGGI